MEKLEKFLKENASEKPLVINESLLLNSELEDSMEQLEEKLKKLEKEGKIKYRHENFPTESTNIQLVIEWIK